MILLTKLLEIYKDEYELNLKEGLIKTVDLGKSCSILNKKYKNIFNIIQFKDSFVVKAYSSTNKLLNEFIQDANNLGWFPSYIVTDGYEGKHNPKVYKDNNEIELRFEAKYDKIVDKIPNFLYHITPAINWEKIQKIGLSPKSRSKASVHPERVYLTSTLKTAEFLGPLFYQKTGDVNYVILKIDTELIPGDYLKLYKDPNYENGFYTLNNIPPQSIKKIKDIKLK